MVRKSGKSKTEEANPDVMPSVSEAMAEMQRSALSSLAWFGNGWAEVMGEMSSEMLQFVADRVKEDVKFHHRCLHCKTVKELQDVQAEFMQKAVDQYTAETGKLVEIGSTALAPSKKPN